MGGLERLGVSPIYHNITQGGLQILLQYYSFEGEMDGHNPFSAWDREDKDITHFSCFLNMDIWLSVLSWIRKNGANTCFTAVRPVYYILLGGWEGSLKLITILYGGVLSYQFITILHGGGVSRDPKFVLRNIWTAPNQQYNTQAYMQKTCDVAVKAILAKKNCRKSA